MVQGGQKETLNCYLSPSVEVSIHGTPRRYYSLAAFMKHKQDCQTLMRH